MAAPLTLEGKGDDWRLHLNGDWSLAAMAPIEAQLKHLPDGLHGTLVCDWSHAEAPGIGPSWVLLMRLADFGTQHLDIRHADGREWNVSGGICRQCTACINPDGPRKRGLATR